MLNSFNTTKVPLLIFVTMLTSLLLHPLPLLYPQATTNLFSISKFCHFRNVMYM